MFTSIGCVVGLWSTTHTSGGEQLQLHVLPNRGLFICRGSVPEMQRVCTCCTTEITNHCYTAKITLCSLVGDCHTPVSLHRALARVGH